MDFESLILKMTQAAVRGDGKTVADCFTDDGVYHDVFYGDFMGHEIAGMIENHFHRDGQNFIWDVFEPVAQGNVGYARYVFSYDSRLPGSENRRAVFEGVAICHLREEQIIDYREVATAATGLALMGFSAAKISRFIQRETEKLVNRPETVHHLAACETPV